LRSYRSDNEWTVSSTKLKWANKPPKTTKVFGWTQVNEYRLCVISLNVN